MRLTLRCFLTFTSLFGLAAGAGFAQQATVFASGLLNPSKIITGPGGSLVAAEVEEIVPVGSLDPDCIHLPSIYVNRVILGSPYEKKIEFRTVRQHEAA